MSNVHSLFQEQSEPTPEPSRFDEFWKAYPMPKRVGKAVAKAKFDAITGPHGLKTKTFDKDSNSYVEIELRGTPDEIIKGVEAYARMNKKTGSGAFGYVDDGKFLLHPSTFLNRGRWLDFI